ncbi:cation diffusion facilitator family transporter [Algihabitans albus]|uniref:cation diffusion facilitator family transporter n=1 Tax=Algihabitans albus TaxID=2164067 RepID=UPI0013C2E2FD|nr:cation diffusion facilitator family transporter [Algihabitans albus]
MPEPATAKPQRLDARRAGRLMKLATYASVATASVLIVVKLGAWWLTDSVSMLSSLVDSLLDVAASLVTLLAVRQALVPADQEHRFGHGKAEPLAALLQSGLIAGSAVLLAFEVIHRLVRPEAVEHGRLGVAVMVFSIALTFALVRFQRYVVRRTGSSAIAADSLHYFSDLLMNAAVIAALVLASEFGLLRADPLIGLGVACYILYSAYRIGRDALGMLMDRELPPEERERILQVVRGYSEVLGVHDLKTRTSGPRTFIQLHLELDGGMTLYRAHAIAEAVEAELQTAFPDAEVIIHQDPHVLAEETPQYGT